MSSLTRRWPKLVGSELWIYTSHAIWMQQLSFAKPELLAQINTFLQEWLAGERSALDAPACRFSRPARVETSLAAS